MLRTISIIAILAAAPALAQETQSGAASQAIAIVGGGGASSTGSVGGFQKGSIDVVATTPDAIAPSGAPAGETCAVPDSFSASVFVAGVSRLTYRELESCIAERRSAHMAELAALADRRGMDRSVGDALFMLAVDSVDPRADWDAAWDKRWRP